MNKQKSVTLEKRRKRSEKKEIKNKDKRLEHQKPDELKIERQDVVFRIKKSKKSVRNKDGREKTISDRENTTAATEKDTKSVKRKTRKPSKWRMLISRTGKTNIFVSGANAVRAVSAISKMYRVENVSVSREGAAFFVQSKHCEKIIALLNNLCYDYKIIGNSGIMPRAMLTIARAGLVVGIAAVVALFAIYPSFVTRVSVQCVDGQSINGTLNSQVYDILSSHGISEGKRIGDVDLNAIQKQLLALDSVSYASVEKSGTHVKVLLKTQLPDGFADIAGSSVVARKRAVVTRVIVESGTAVKKYGDVVDVGDVIIDGYVEYGDEKIPAQASGYAYGKVYYLKRVFFPDTLLEKRYGQVKTVTKLSMFSKTPKRPVSPFECCECKISVQNLGFLLPFEIYTYRFTELIVEEVPNQMSEDQMQQAVYADIVSEFTEETKVLDRVYKTERADGGVYISVTVEAEELI